VMVKLGVLPWGNATHTRSRLVVSYSLWRMAWAQVPSFGLWRPLAFVDWGSTWFVVLRPASGLRTQA
jgi:hypothetical protein